MNSSHVVLVLAGLIGLGLYAWACQRWPYVTCGRCKGGKHPSPSKKAWRNCGRCKGTGKRLRLFAR